MRVYSIQSLQNSAKQDPKNNTFKGFIKFDVLRQIEPVKSRPVIKNISLNTKNIVAYYNIGFKELCIQMVNGFQYSYPNLESSKMSSLIAFADFFEKEPTCRVSIINGEGIVSKEDDVVKCID